MKKRFTSNELFSLRNLIPIDVLIGKKLMIPSKFSEGFFRFLCPLCNEFQTATNPKTNLARCFRCERNFNTIDIVMICRKVNFVQSVKYLKEYQKTISNNKSTDANDTSAFDKKTVALGQIFKNFGFPGPKTKSLKEHEHG